MPGICQNTLNSGPFHPTVTSVWLIEKETYKYASFVTFPILFKSNFRHLPCNVPTIDQSCPLDGRFYF